MGLMNWPPSRGPMPAHMRKKPKYEIPELIIEPVEWVPSRNGRKPATEIKRIPTKPAPEMSKKNKALLKRGIHSMADMIARDNAKPKVYLRLNYHVATTATLKPEQWDLIGGAELVPARKPALSKREALCHVSGGKAYATLSNHLPVRTITVDLEYPMSMTARVTIRPYSHVIPSPSGRLTRKFEEMTIGYVLWQLARAYKIIYRQHKTYGIWGHAITDLCFESFELNDNIGHVSIGS